MTVPRNSLRVSSKRLRTVSISSRVMTTGGSIREVVSCVEAAGGAVVGVGSLIDRSGGTTRFPVKRVSLATVKAETWTPEECPLCRSGGRAVKPGSRV